MNDESTSVESVPERLTRLGQTLNEGGSIADRVLDELGDDRRQTIVGESVVETDPATHSRSHDRVKQGALAVLAASVIVVATLLLLPARPLLAQVARNVQRASSYTVTLKAVMDNKDEQPSDGSAEGKWYWRSPNDFRIEDPGETRILFADRAGISWRDYDKTYRSEPAQQGYISPLMVLQDLGRFAEEARSIGSQQINGVPCQGYSIDMQLIEPSAASGKVTLWIDPSTELPARLAFPSNDWEGHMVFEDFDWNVELDDALFSVTAPAGYSLSKRRPVDLTKKVEKIVQALGNFKHISGGHYPRVKVIYGDVTRDKMYAMAGYQKGNEREFLHEDRYVRILESTFGFAAMNSLMRENADCVYQGMTVMPDDKEQVLFRWKLDNGLNQVIYGDLRADQVADSELAR